MGGAIRLAMEAMHANLDFASVPTNVNGALKQSAGATHLFSTGLTSASASQS
jgi:hypothetical protein